MKHASRSVLVSLVSLIARSPSTSCYSRAPATDVDGVLYCEFLHSEPHNTRLEACKLQLQPFLARLDAAWSASVDLSQMSRYGTFTYGCTGNSGQACMTGCEHMMSNLHCQCVMACCCSLPCDCLSSYNWPGSYDHATLWCRLWRMMALFDVFPS